MYGYKMYGYNGKSVGYFSSFWEFYFCTKWFVYACMVTYIVYMYLAKKLSYMHMYILKTCNL